MRTRRRMASFWLVALVATVLVLGPRSASAGTRLEDICAIAGQTEVKLVGIGLVVGLNGTGDGGKNLPAMRALAAALKLLNLPVLGQDELKQNADNMAVVLIEATVPRTGLRRGQRIDCFVSSPFGAESLAGGRLLVAPVETADLSEDTMVGLTSGAIYIEDANTPTSGTIPRGVVLERDFASHFVDEERGDVITLLLDAEHSSFYSASEVARVVNLEFSFESSNEQLAKAVGPGVIEVQIPAYHKDSPVEFVAQVLEVRIDNPHTQGRVVVNAKTGVVIVTGEVEISPVVISHKNFTVEVGGPPAGLTGDRFVAIDDLASRSAPQQLDSLVQSLNRLRIPTADIIDIIRELYRSGKLHAVYDEH